MTDNRLKLNHDKSHLLVFTSSQARARSQSANLVIIHTDREVIKPSESEKLLGCRIQSNLKYTEYLIYSEENLFRALNLRLNAIKKISNISDFKTRKTFGNGIFMSKLAYMIIAWSSCSNELNNALQVIQNRVARVVTKNDWTKSNQDNLKQMGWLSVN